MSKIKLEIGEYYEDEMHDVWEIKRGNYKCFMAVNSSGVGRWYNDDGTCRGHSGKDSHYPKCKLVRKVFPNRIVAGKGIGTTTLAEELREVAKNYNSIEGQPARLKEKAIEAAKQGKTRIEIDKSMHRNEQLSAELAKDGFTVVSEFIQTPDLVRRGGSKILSKVYLSWNATDSKAGAK